MAEASKYPQICKNAAKLKEFVEMIEELRSIAETEPLSVLFEKTLDNTGYRSMLIAGGEEEADRLNNVRELVSSAVDYEREKGDGATLQNYLEEVALLSDVDDYDDEGNFVTLMTIHSAKGLEFPIVFIPGLEEGIFPGSQSLLLDDEIEEERRLAYVAITRAKEKLYCIHTKERIMYGRTQYNPPSRFINEIPSDLTEKTGVTSYSSFKRSAESEPYKDFGEDFTSGRPIKRGFSGQSSFSKPAQSAPASSASFKVGDTVKHKVFGTGVVLSAQAVGNDTLLEIAFDKSGTKKLMANYAKLTT
jgi:DNA helicase-2/ATP-dependent DNA helicase PcrA